MRDLVVARPGGRVLLSVVVPCYDEEDGLKALLYALHDELGAITPDYEIIAVDDGSRDGTLEILRSAAEDDARLRYLALSRNFGKEAAMLAGLEQAGGDSVVIMDADLQHPPALIARMLPYLDRGYDQVVARRTRTGDRALRTFAARGYYRLMNRIVEVNLEDGVGDFRALSRKAVNAVLALGEYNRFSKGLFSWIGFDTAVVDYENVARAEGVSKWRLRDLANYGIDGVLSFNTRPLRMAIHLGLFVSAIAFGYAIWVVIDAAARGIDVPGYVTIICAVVGFGGVQMIMLGVIGEYLGRIYAEAKSRPHFILKEASPGVVPAHDGPRVTPR